MIQKLINDLMKSDTAEKIMSYKPQILDLYNSLNKKIENQTYSITNFEDIENLHRLKYPMMAYYGPYFYSQCGFPFLKEHNPKTIDIIEFSVLFYSIQILELLENGFFDKASLCIYDINRSLEIFDHTEKINLTEYKYKKDLFAVLWFYFMEVITIEDNNREFTIEYDNNTDIFYLGDEKHEAVLDMIYKNYDGSEYSSAINRILGIYRMRFTKMKYILEYQPLFVEVAYEYLCAIMTDE